MARWFRMYDDVVDDPKVQRLSERLFKAWVNCMCLASKNGGTLPELKDVAYRLRLSEDKAAKVLDELKAEGLFDENENNEVAPHNWDERQFKSDVSTDRVKRFRKRHETVSETPPEQSIDRTEQNRKDVKVLFERFCKAYPKRKGADPRAPAENKFKVAIKNGEDPEIIIAAARQYAAEAEPNTPYIAQKETWLNQRRWEDYREIAEAERTASAALAGKFRIKSASDEYYAWQKTGKNVWDGCYVDSQWPPGHPNAEKETV